MKDKTKIELEFYSDGLPNWVLQQFKKEPSSFNGMINVQKYKLTIELVEEPKEIIIERIKKLYEEETNWHNKDALNLYCIRNFGIKIYDLINKK